MSHNQGLIAELKQEAANTRKILQAVPEDKMGWKPHDKSMTLGALALHVAELPSWIVMVLHTSELDFAKSDYNPKSVTTAAELVAILDENVAKAVEALENASPEDMQQPWTMRNGEQIYFTLPKSVVMRTWSFSHGYHHRGQLSVYLRLLNIFVPGMYGPSADEMELRATAAAEAIAEGETASAN